MENLIYSFIFVLGLIVGSFLNCVIYRLEEEKSFLKGRSFCPACKKELAWFDLIPVLSFIFLRGRCRYCKARISWQYPLVELANGVIFLSLYVWLLPLSGSSLINFFNLFYYWVVSAFLVVIFVYDLKHYVVPNITIYLAIIISLLWRLVGWLAFDPSAWLEFLKVIGIALVPAILFLLIVLLSRGRWMGEGDISIVFLMGLILGWPGILVALAIAFYSGAIIGLGLMAIGRKKLKSAVPFAPFLIAGIFLSLFWQSQLIDWYQALFLLK